MFENLAPTDFAVGQEHIWVVSGGRSYAWTGDLLPKVAGNAKSRGTLGFFIDGPLDLNDAVLVAGRGEQNQAAVPLGAQGTGKLLLPRNEQVSGTATAGGLAVDLVSAIVTAGDFEFNQNAPKGKVVVHLELQATTTERYGDNFIGNHLAVETPDGEQATPLGGSNVVLAADAKASSLYADFAVPEPAMGKFVLVVRQQTERSPIPFTLS